ncbi:ankyrin repeat domain-containing protein [Wolbachia endosymbiont (group B) of Carcina quercana]|uniref:ankyrin repeat domain-containing protein n=1 Tax=Wolbachia endosymbiont (group B) of Carcina quercana TaxID=2953992 RepID=UPI00221F17D3|nr:ankyrin repeat domain-containing protein [Wolbachia endosymbiont (group B) of Carcina quercana]
MSRNVRRLFHKNSIIRQGEFDGLIFLIVLTVCIVVIYFSLFKKGDESYSATLEIAAKNCDLETVKSLIKDNISIGEKSLRYVAGEGCLEIVRFLVEDGIDINATNKFKWTALHSAADQGKLEIIRFLLDKGSDPTIRDTDGKTPRKIAVLRSRHNKDKPYDEIIKLLAEAEDRYKSIERNH